MKRRDIIFIALLCAAAPTAGASRDVLAPAAVTVVNFNWYDNSHREGWDRPAVDAGQRGVEDTRPMPTRRGEPSPARPPVTSEGVGPDGAPVRPSREPLLRRRVAEYVYRLRLRNEAREAIVGVDWEYQFLDPESGKELGRHRFQSRRQVKPGQEATLEEKSISPPSLVVSAAGPDAGGRSPFNERVLVRCVAYKDGSIGRAPGAAADDCAGLASGRNR